MWVQFVNCHIQIIETAERRGGAKKKEKRYGWNCILSFISRDKMWGFAEHCFCFHKRLFVCMYPLFSGSGIRDHYTSNLIKRQNNSQSSAKLKWNGSMIPSTGSKSFLWVSMYIRSCNLTDGCLFQHLVYFYIQRLMCLLKKKIEERTAVLPSLRELNFEDNRFFPILQAVLERRKHLTNFQ